MNPIFKFVSEMNDRLNSRVTTLEDATRSLKTISEMVAKKAEQLVEDDGDEIEVCSGCKTEVHGVGEDGISYCSHCEVIVEGATERMTEKEYERYHG